MKRKGFTLVEILVTTVIILGIFISIAGILQRSVRMREKGSEMTEKTRIGTALIDIMRRDLNAMAFYPRKTSIYFSITPDRGPTITSDSMSSRRDTLSFDTLVPFVTESGIMIWRFGRVTYSIEEQFGMPEYKRLVRKTVLINDEYSSEDVEEIVKKELDEKKSDEGSSKEEAEQEEQEIMEDIALDQGLTEAVLSRRVSFFSIDVMSEDQTGWKEKEVKNRVPAVIKVSIGFAGSAEQDDGFENEKNEMTFTTVLRPVIARYVSNPYSEKPADTGRPLRDVKFRDRLRRVF